MRERPGVSLTLTRRALPTRRDLCKNDRRVPMRIVEFLRPDAIIATIGGTSAQAVLAELTRPLCGAYKLDPQRLLDTLLDREKLG